MTIIDAEVKSSFATAVRAWRKQLGITQEQLAERADLHRTYISDVERGARNLSLESISKLARALEVSVATLFQNAPAGGGTSSRSASPTGTVDILLVEDSVDDVEMSLHAFRKARFANRIHVVCDGLEALDYLFSRGTYAQRNAEDRPQLIILDLNLPKLSGLEFLKRLRAEPQTQSIPVVVLTVSEREKDIAECRRLGVECYVTKPLNLQRLSEVTPQLQLDWALFKSAVPARA